MTSLALGYIISQMTMCRNSTLYRLKTDGAPDVLISYFMSLFVIVTFTRDTVNRPQVLIFSQSAFCPRFALS